MTSGYLFRPMNEEDAHAIAAWHYEVPYDVYDMASDPDDLAELLDPERRQDYNAVLPKDGEKLVGFFCFGVEVRGPDGDYADDGALDVGLGLRLDLTCRGLGLKFLLAGLEFARRRFSPDSFHLYVATFNERAIRVYGTPASGVQGSSCRAPMAESILSC
jgi:ribosomal-protein-alanine N-acetyltransferase